MSDAALVDVVEAAEQVDDRGLARAALADDADPLAGLDLEGDVLEDRLVAVVAEGDVLEDDVALHVGHARWARRPRRSGSGVSRISKVRWVAVRKPVSQLVSCVRLRQRLVEHPQVAEERPSAGPG